MEKRLGNLNARINYCHGVGGSIYMFNGTVFSNDV
jgi:hypothetical protein